VNAPWNFLHSLMSKGSSGKNPYQYLPEQRVKQIADSLYIRGTGKQQLINFSLTKPTM
jgi:hypothetical protein